MKRKRCDMNDIFSSECSLHLQGDAGPEGEEGASGFSGGMVSSLNKTQHFIWILNFTFKWFSWIISQDSNEAENFV